MVTRTIGVGSGIGTPDFSDFQTWWDFLDATLTAPEVLEVLWASSANEITIDEAHVFNFTGITTSSTNTITIKAATGVSLSDDASNPLRYDPTLGACVKMTTITACRLNNAWVNIQGLMFIKTSNYNSLLDIRSDNNIIERCILCIGGTSDATIISTPAAGSNLVIRNCILYNKGSPWSGADGMFFWGGNIQFYNNIVAYIGSSPNGIGLHQRYSTPVVKNTVVFGWPTDASNDGGAVAGTNNATDKATFGGSGYDGGTPQTSITASSEFMNVTAGSEDFRLKDTSPKLKDNGTSGTGVPSTDFFSQARNGNTDIGVFEVQATGGGAFTLDAAQGTYTLTGQSAGLKSAKKLIAAQGTYSITGQVAGLKIGRKIATAQGSYSLTGQAAILKRGLKIPAAQGSYSLVGQDANLIAPTAKVLPANQGTYQISGQDARLAVGRKVGAVQGTYALTGQVALLRKSYTALPAAQGSYTLVGQSAAFLRTIIMPAAQGQYNLFGQAATLSYSGEIQPEGFDWLLRYRRKRR